MKVREHMIVTGKVQDVGFRYRSYHIATSLGLTGWVENQWDGSVELEVQGEETTIEQFIERLKNERFIWIADIERDRVSVVETERAFRIRG